MWLGKKTQLGMPILQMELEVVSSFSAMLHQYAISCYIFYWLVGGS